SMRRPTRCFRGRDSWRIAFVCMVLDRDDGIRSEPARRLDQGAGRGTSSALHLREVDLVQAALALQTEEAQVLLARHLVDRACRVPVADAEVALFPQRVIGKTVPLEVAV